MPNAADNVARSPEPAQAPTSLSGSAARGALVTLAGQALRALIQFGSVAVLSRMLSPTDFGVYAMVFSLVGIASLLTDFGLSMSSIQARDVTDEQRTNLFWLNVVFGLVVSVAVFALAHPISSFYRSTELVHVTELLSVAFLIDAASAQFKAELNAQLRFRWLAAVDVVSQAFGLGVAIVLALLGEGYWALVWQQIAVVSTVLVVAFVGAGWKPGLPRRGQDMRHHLSFGASTFGVQALVYVTSNIDNVLLGRVTDASTLGAYNRAYQLFRLPVAQLASPLTKVAFPILARVRDDRRTYERYLHRGQLALAYGLAGLFLILAGESGPIVDILLGSQWNEAKALFVILAVGGCFQALGYVYYWVFLSRGLTSIQVRYSLISRSLMVLAIVAGLHWGAIGVALGASVGQLLAWLVNAVLAMPRAGVDPGPLIAAALRPFLLLAPLTPIGLVLDHVLGLDPWASGVIIAGAMAIYIGLAYAVFGWLRRDTRLLAATAQTLRRARPAEVTTV